MQKLIELAEKIQDKELRKQVIEFIKNPTLSHKDFKKYPKEKLEKVKTPFSVGNMGTAVREVVNHTAALTEICISTADVIKKYHGLEVNKDYLIAGALLHDIAKVFEWKNTDEGPEHTGIPLDHSILGVAELYHRGFPEEVIHIVASHFGESGPTPPRNFEALVVHYIDTMLSLAEFQINRGKSKQQIPMLVLDEDFLKKLGEKTEKEEK